MCTSIHVCVCVCVCTYVCMYVCMHACMYACMHACMHPDVYCIRCNQVSKFMYFLFMGMLATVELPAVVELSSPAASGL